MERQILNTQLSDKKRILPDTTPDKRRKMEDDDSGMDAIVMQK